MNPLRLTEIRSEEQVKSAMEDFWFLPKEAQDKLIAWLLTELPIVDPGKPTTPTKET